MITLQNRFLALWARSGADGLLTIDGAFVTELWGQPPIQRSLALVIQVTDDNPGEPHAFIVEATFDADGEQVYRDEGSFTIPTANQTSVVIYVALNLRREGSYSITLRVDGGILATLPLPVVFKSV